MALLSDFVVETSSAPGTSTTINLAGVATGPFRTFAAAFSSGQKVFYEISDEVSQRESGIGTFTAGAPSTLSRDTVKSNTSGTLSRLNFIGTVYVYCTIPATNAVYADESGNVAFPGIAVSATSMTLSGAMTSASANVTGNATVGGTLGVTGASTLHNTTVIGNETVSGTLGVAGTETVGPGTNSTITINGSSTSAGVLVNSLASPAAPFTCFASNIAAPTSVHARWDMNGGNMGSITQVAGTGVQYNTTSDARLKIDDGLIDGDEATRILLSLRPRWFRWKSDPDAASTPGFFAQQVSRVFPWAVVKGKGKVGSKRFRPWQMDNSKLVPLLTAALQDAHRRIEALEKLK